MLAVCGEIVSCVWQVCTTLQAGSGRVLRGKSLRRFRRRMLVKEQICLRKGCLYYQDALVPRIHKGMARTFSEMFAERSLRRESLSLKVESCAPLCQSLIPRQKKKKTPSFALNQKQNPVAPRRFLEDTS